MLLLKFPHRVSTTPGNLWPSPEHNFQTQCTSTPGQWRPDTEMVKIIFPVDSFTGSADTALHWERVNFSPKRGYIRWVPGSSAWTLSVSHFSFSSSEPGWFNFPFTHTKARRWEVQLACWFMNVGWSCGFSILLPFFLLFSVCSPWGFVWQTEIMRAVVREMVSDLVMVMEEENRISAAHELCQREGHQLNNIQSQETT